MPSIWPSHIHLSSGIWWYGYRSSSSVTILCSYGHTPYMVWHTALDMARPSLHVTAIQSYISLRYISGASDSIENRLFACYASRIHGWWYDHWVAVPVFVLFPQFYQYRMQYWAHYKYYSIGTAGTNSYLRVSKYHWTIFGHDHRNSLFEGLTMTWHNLSFLIG